MPIRDSHPIQFIPAGVTDATDQTSAFPGACQIASNLIFDRVNRGAIVPRPGVELKTDFADFLNPSTVSVMFTVGTLIYGMIGSQANPGFDEPFCYDTVAQNFITVSGVTANNVPVTQVNTGDWTPPTMDAVGIYVIVTHPGFTGSNRFGYFNVTNSAAPTWTGGNTTVNLLPAVPTWVCQFFGRAYFGIRNAVYFTDLLALSITNTNFAAVLTLGDRSPSVAAKGLPMSQTSGAVLQSLVIFKNQSIWQISGDISQNSLSLNEMALNIGCNAPRTVVSTPMGIIFIANDGPRYIDFIGRPNYLQARQGATPDIVAPFATATNPTRMVGVYANGIYRVCLGGNYDIWDSVYTSQDYWYDFIFQRWTGPHTFDYHCGVNVNDTFYLSSNTLGRYIFTSTATPSATSVYQDNGTDILCELVSCAIEGEPMTMSCAVESTIELGGAGIGSVYYISMYDDRNNNLSPATIKLYDVNPLWGSVKWGQFLWRSVASNSQVFTIPWVNPIVFKKMVVSVRIAASANVSIKSAFVRVQTLGYTNA